MQFDEADEQWYRVDREKLFRKYEKGIHDE